MKKSYLFSAFAAGMVMLSACSGDGDLTGGNVGNESNDAVQEIVLQVANTGEGLQTRAGRPLYSSQADQSIDKVKIIICNAAEGADKNKVVYAYTVENWNNDKVSQTYTTGGHGRKKTLLLTGNDRLGMGKYTIYAFGYSSEDCQYGNIDEAIVNINKNDIFNPNTVLNLKTPTTVKGEEIFAGSKENLELDANNKGFDEAVVLNRQVAGTFGYFKDIPYVEGATTLQLVASNPNTSLVLGKFGNFDLANNGENTDHINYVINGTTPSSGLVIYSINLESWFGGPIADKDNNKLIDTDKWHNAIGDDKAKFKTGSVFGGSFLIPFAKVDGKNTFVLQLTNGKDVLKEWTVKLPSTDGQVNGIHTLFTWNGTGFISKEGAKDDQKTYNVVRNHLYGIGKRSLDKPINPDKPDPGTPDEPEPLNKKQELTLRVNDNWEVIHQMELE